MFLMSLIPELVEKFFSKEKQVQIPDNAISEKIFNVKVKDLENYFHVLTNNANRESFIEIACN